MSPPTEDDPTGRETSAARARSLLRLAPVSALPVAAGLWVGGAAWWDVLLLPLILGVLPVLAVAQALMLREVELQRLPAYASSVVAMTVLASISYAAGVQGAGPAAVGLVPMAVAPFLGWTILLTALGLGIMAAFRLLAGSLGLSEHPVLRELLPRSSGEKWAFVAVSFSAGIGEELVFRGYAILALSPFLGLTGAAVLTTVAFGVVHAYQGALGFARTALLGGVLAWAFLATGSILPSMAAHTLLDIVAGIFLGERLMVPDGDSRV